MNCKKCKAPVRWSRAFFKAVKEECGKEWKQLDNAERRDMILFLKRKHLTPTVNPDGTPHECEDEPVPILIPETRPSEVDPPSAKSNKSNENKKEKIDLVMIERETIAMLMAQVIKEIEKHVDEENERLVNAIQVIKGQIELEFALMKKEIAAIREMLSK